MDVAQVQFGQFVHVLWTTGPDELRQSLQVSDSLLRSDVNGRQRPICVGHRFRLQGLDQAHRVPLHVPLAHLLIHTHLIRYALEGIGVICHQNLGLHGPGDRRHPLLHIYTPKASRASETAP